MFSISINTYTFEQKRRNENIFAWNEFVCLDVTLEEMASLINQGHLFTHDFGLEHFNSHQRIATNFVSTCFVAIDVDECPITMEQAVEMLPKKPTLYYYTANNGHKGEGYRYRFIYLFDEPISREIYQPLARALFSYLEGHIEGFVSSDNCHLDKGRQFMGADGNINVTEGATYRIEDFELVECETKLSASTPVSATKEESRMPDTEFYQDLKNFEDYQFLDKYYRQYYTRPYSHCVDVNGINGIEYFNKETYIEVGRKWEAIESNGKVKRYPHRFVDGESRRKRLFAVACTYRHITRNMTIENLIVDLIYEKVNFYDNSDNVLNNKEIYAIAKRVMDIECDSLKCEYECHKKSFKTTAASKEYCTSKGITLRSLINSEAKNLRYGKLLEYYQFEKSVIENEKYLMNLNRKDIPYSRKTLYSFLEWVETNLSEVYQYDKSIDENIKHIQSLNRKDIPYSHFAITEFLRGNLINRKKREKQYVTNSTQKLWTDDELKDVVDATMSACANVKRCKEQGMEVSLHRMYQYYHHNGIPLKATGRKKKD